MEKPDHVDTEASETPIAEQKKPKRKSPPKKKSPLKPAAENTASDVEIRWQFTFPAVEFERELDAVAENYSQQAKLPGFRKGRVSGSVVKSVYRQSIEDEVARKLVLAAVKDKLEREKTDIVSQPRIVGFERNEKGDFQADVILETRPAINLPVLDSLRVEIGKQETLPAEWDEDKEIDAILMAHRRPEKVSDRAVAADDMLLIRSQAKIVETKRLMPRQEKYIRLDGDEEQEISALKEELLGRVPGEKVVFKRSYPADWPKKSWAGREIEHQVEIVSIFTLGEVEWNADLSRALGVKDENDLRVKVRENRHRQLEQSRQNLITDKIISLLLEKVDVQSPKSLVEAEFIELLKRNQAHLAGLADDQRPVMLAGLRDAAEKAVKISLVMEAVEKQFDLVISEADLEVEMNKIAAANNVQLEEVRKYLGQEKRLENLRDRLLESRIIAFLKDKISVVEV